MTNKLLLAAIAFGLWAVGSTSASATELAGSVQQIAEEVRHLVEHGEKCLNPQPVSATEVKPRHQR
jgi:hypothetical protein